MFAKTTRKIKSNPTADKLETENKLEIEIHFEWSWNAVVKWEERKPEWFRVEKLGKVGQDSRKMYGIGSCFFGEVSTILKGKATEVPQENRGGERGSL